MNPRLGLLGIVWIAAMLACQLSAPAPKPVSKLEISEQKDLTTVEDMAFVSISPNGRWLLALRSEPRAICIFVAASLEEKFCADWRGERPYGTHVSWSRNSQYVALDENLYLKADLDIWLLDVAAGKLNNLTEDNVWTEGGAFSFMYDAPQDANPVFSPDGKMVAFVRSLVHAPQGGEGDINAVFQVARSGGEPEALFDIGHPFAANCLVWSEDGSKIYYLYSLEDDPRNSRNGFWVIDRDGRNPRKLLSFSETTQRAVLLGVSTHQEYALILQEQSSFQKQFSLFNIQTGKEYPLTPGEQALTDFDGEINTATFSPDGSKILYLLRGQDAQGRDLHRLVVRSISDSQEIVLLTETGNNPFFPANILWAENDLIFVDYYELLVSLR